MALDIPVEILHETISYLDDISTIRFLSTCTFLYKQEIKCTKLLIKSSILNSAANRLQWHSQCSHIDENNILIVTNFKKYCNIRKYQHMYKIYINMLPKIRIYGFYTDIKLSVLVTMKFVNNDNIEILYSEIIDHGDFREIIFESLVYNHIHIDPYTEHYWYMNIYCDSEIIMNRHPLYFENNIEVHHTTLHKIEIYGESYFISCYTEAINFNFDFNSYNTAF